MATTINWATKEINISRAGLTLVQSSPSEIRELNLNEFRVDLKDLEDDEEGMVFIRTHNHNTEVLLGGIVYARTLEIINDYTITFEDGQYAVNLVGSNSNVGDVVNLNQVSIRSANAAGLISNSAIEYSSFNGGVTVDVINGIDGTTFPIGTPRSPARTVQDAVLISEFRGFTTLYIRGDLVLDTGNDVTGYEIIGEATNKTLIQINTGAIVTDIEVKDATIGGVFDGKATFTRCILLDADFVEAEISECTLRGEITLAGAGDTIIEDSRDGLLLSNISPSINFNNSDHNLAIRDYHGDLNIKNKSGDGNVEINMNSGGRITLEPSVSSGRIRLTGTLQLIDDSTGTTVVDDSQVIYPEYLQLSSFDQEIHIDVDNGASGTKFPIGTTQNPVNNISDAIAIGTQRGLSQFAVYGTLVIIGKNLDGYTIVGKSMTSVAVLVPNTGNSNNNTTFRDIGLAGQLNGYIYADRCAVQELSGIGSDTFPTVFSNAIIRSDDVASAMTLRNGLTTAQDVHFFNCVSAALDGEIVTIDFNGSTSGLGFRNFAGSLQGINYTGGQESTLTLSEGSLTLDSSNTNGTIILKANELIDNSNGLTVTYNTSTWTAAEKNESLAYGKKASDNAEQLNTRI